MADPGTDGQQSDLAFDNIWCKNLRVTGSLSIDGVMVLGDAAADTLTVNGAATFADSVATSSDVTMTMAGTENLNIINTTLGAGTKGVYIEMECGSAVAGTRQGALMVELGRSTLMTNSDGNPDCAVKISSSDWSDGGAGYARIRGMDLKAQNDGDNGNSTVFINAAYITAENATGMANSGDMSVCHLNMKNNGTITGENLGLYIQDQSQGATTGDTIGILIGTSAYAMTREHAIEIGTAGGSWTNILHLTDDDHTYLIDADVEGGAVGATRTSPNQTATCDGSFVVMVGAKALLVPLYNAVTVA